jgi:tetratricopeptide (TPR) repeat protein
VSAADDDDLEDARELRAFGALCVGASCLGIFVQENWTGPNLPAADGAKITALLRGVMGAADDDTDAALEARAVDMLWVDGEPAFTQMRRPAALVLGRVILQTIADPEGQTVGELAKGKLQGSARGAVAARARGEGAGGSALRSASWWCARSAMVHQQSLVTTGYSAMEDGMAEHSSSSLLTLANTMFVRACDTYGGGSTADEASATLKPAGVGAKVVEKESANASAGVSGAGASGEAATKAALAAEIAAAAAAEKAETKAEKSPTEIATAKALAAQVWLERGLMLHHRDDTKGAKKAFFLALAGVGLSVGLTGSMGKRTKYQSFTKSQLLLRLTRVGGGVEDGDGAEDRGGDDAGEKSAEVAEKTAVDGAATDAVVMKAVGGATGEVATTGAAGGAEEKEGGDAPIKHWSEQNVNITGKVSEGDGSGSVLGKAAAAAAAAEEGGDGDSKNDDIVIDTTGKSGFAVKQLQRENDSILLDRLALDDEGNKIRDNQAALSELEQAVIMGLCLDVQNSNAMEGLTREEMMAYVSCVIEMPNNWVVHSSALLVKCFLEFEHFKSRERAALQLQALVDQHTNRLSPGQMAGTEDPAPAAERMKRVYQTVFPPHWAMKRKLADRYYKLGVVRSALEIYKELFMWEDVVQCLIACEEYKKAEALTREQLELAPTPLLWMILGTLTNDDAHLETAWAVSRHRFTRAKRQLGRRAFDRGDLLGCIRHMQEALEANQMFPSAWFRMGTAALRLKKWELACKSFTRVVHLLPDDGESWANLGSIHARRGRYEQAFKALSEAVKHKRQSWKMWENLLILSVGQREWGRAIEAFGRLLDLKDERASKADCVDIPALQALVKAVCTHVVAKTGGENALLGAGDDEEKKAQEAAVAEAEEEAGGFLWGSEEDEQLLAEALRASNEKEEEGNDGSDGEGEKEEEEEEVNEFTAPKGGGTLITDWHVDRVQKLMGRITAVVSTVPQIWLLYAALNAARGNMDKELDCRLKQCRTMQKAGWDNDEEAVADVAEAVVKLSDLYLLKGDNKSLRAGVMYVRGVIRKTEATFSGMDEVVAMVSAFAKLEAALKLATP